MDLALSRLLAVKERIDDTEDLVAIDLDHRRNRIVALDLIVTSIMLATSFVTAIAGVFGMNMVNGWEGSHVAFVAVTLLSFVVGATIFLVFVAYVRRKGLLFVPDPASFLRLAVV